MKITAIEAFHVVVPLARPYKLSRRYGTVTHAHAVLLRVETDEGLVGWGEADPMPPFTDETWGSVFAAVKHHFGPALVGTDPTAVNARMADLDAILSGNLLARGALDVALWDLAGKALGVPVHRLLGGALRREVPILWPFGSGTPEQDVERIEAKMEEGYRTFMIKMGALPIDTEIARVYAIEEAFGDEVRFNVDANQGWDLPRALAFVEGIKGCGVDFVEQPVPRDQVWALSTLRARATHPLSADEGVQTLAEASELAARRLVDVFSLKISKNGGISRSLHIGRLAEAFGIRCLVNSMIELGVSQAAGLQVAAVLPNLLDCGQCFMSTLRMSRDLTSFSQQVDRAVVQVTDAPGLGVEVDEPALGRYAQESIRVDGSR